VSPDPGNPEEPPIETSVSLAGIPQLSPPIVVVGMRRSGTTVLGYVLSGMGIGMGQSADRHLQALCLHAINNELPRTDQVSWLNPNALVALLSDSGFVGEVARLGERMLGREMGFFEGVQSGQLWGWKAPRTTLALAVSRGLFPGG
jgi:hypothetical protein